MDHIILVDCNRKQSSQYLGGNNNSKALFTCKLGEGITTSDSIIRREMYEMQKHIHGLQMRIKELAEENYELRKKVETIIPEVTGK